MKEIVDSFCGHCAQPMSEFGHDDCARRLELEPPRFCRQCRRRMVVQVTPASWVARCVEHGEVWGPTWM